MCVCACGFVCVWVRACVLDLHVASSSTRLSLSTTEPSAQASPDQDVPSGEHRVIKVPSDPPSGQVTLQGREDTCSHTHTGDPSCSVNWPTVTVSTVSGRWWWPWGVPTEWGTGHFSYLETGFDRRDSRVTLSNYLFSYWCSGVNKRRASISIARSQTHRHPHAHIHTRLYTHLESAQ